MQKLYTVDMVVRQLVMAPDIGFAAIYAAENLQEAIAAEGVIHGAPKLVSVMADLPKDFDATSMPINSSKTVAQLGIK